MYKVIRDVSGDDLEDKLNEVYETYNGTYIVDQVIPTLAFEERSVAMVKVSLPSEIRFNIILKEN